MVFGFVRADVRYGAEMTVVKVVSLDPELISLPAYAHVGDAAADLIARIDLRLEPAGGRGLVPTGVALEIPEGCAALVLPRSGLALHHGVTCLNAPGLIDAGYRGEIGVILVNTDRELAYSVERGDKIAQLLVVSVETAAFVAVHALSETDRGSGGFGHTGR
jgi:dUTP pyrophosphatase